MNIVKVACLRDFLGEIHTGTVRLSHHEVTTTHRQAHLSVKELCLDLQAVNRDDDELIWLHFGVEIQLTPGRDEPWTEHGKALYKSWSDLYGFLMGYLTSEGYDVRNGLYGISKDILPLNGTIEYAKWDRETEKFTWTSP